MNNKICAAFCGTGKSYLCQNFPESYTELECWKYQDDNFPNNYIKDIEKVLESDIKHLFISTNPIILRRLNELGYNITLCYPNNELKEEYLIRYKERGSHPDFISMLNKNWDTWLNELKDEHYCKHIIINENQYLKDIL